MSSFAPARRSSALPLLNSPGGSERHTSSGRAASSAQHPARTLVGSQDTQAVRGGAFTDAADALRSEAVPAGGKAPWSLSGIAVHPLASSGGHTALTINEPDDVFEREAERVTEHVMRRPAATAPLVLTSKPRAAVQKACSCGGTCAACRGKHSDPQQPAVPGSVNRVLGEPGEALDSSARQWAEPRFGFDFSTVRIHRDSRGDESARAIGAKAYTVGSHVVFQNGRYSPDSADGQRLIAHELTHVVQQTQHASQATLQRAPDPALPQPDTKVQPPGPFDLALLDRELTKGGPLTQSQGVIGYGSMACAKGSSCPAAPAAPDSKLPLEAVVYQKSKAATASPPTGTAQPATPAPASPAPRALVVGGIHGDEGGKQQHVLLAERLRKELDAGLVHDFDTVLIPVMNPGGLADNRRTNRHGVDLNRNFPGLPGLPPGSPVVEQPETTAVKQVIQTLHPSRILVLHAQGDFDKGGVYADPVEGEARELACRMALKMKGTGSGSQVVPGNRLDQGVCDSRYPSAPDVAETTGSTSIGTFGSAPRAKGGGGAVVITHEIPDKDNVHSPLAETGPGRSVDSMWPGIKEFLLDNRHSPSEADALLASAVTRTFLSGEGTATDIKLRDTIEKIVHGRFDDMNSFYKTVWRPKAVSAGGAPAAPASLSIVASVGVRDFTKQAGIVNGELGKSLTEKSSDSDIEREILRVMETRSMPGFSRHHWGTDLDVVSAERPDWDPATGKFRSLIPFFQDHAFEFGFFHPYTAGYTRSGGGSPQAGFPAPTARHYMEEPWHLSYWPISNVLQDMWLKTFTGPILDNLILETAHAVHGTVPEATMARVLRGIGLQSFQGDVAPSP